MTAVLYWLAIGVGGVVLGVGMFLAGLWMVCTIADGLREEG